MLDQNSQDSNWISIIEASELFDVPEQSIEKWIRQGKIANRINAQKHREVLSINQTPGFVTQVGFSNISNSHQQPDPNQPTLFDKPADEKPNQSNFANDSESGESVKLGSALAVVSQQAERSLAAAGAAYQEARSLATAYKEELQTARENYHQESIRARKTNRYAWLSVVFAILLIASIAIYTLNQQYQAGSRDGLLNGQRDKIAELENQLKSANEKLTKASTHADKIQADYYNLMTAKLEIEKKNKELEDNTNTLGQQILDQQFKYDQLSDKFDALKKKLGNKGSKRPSMTPEQIAAIQELERKRVEQSRREMEENKRKAAERDRIRREKLAAIKRQEEREKRQNAIDEAAKKDDPIDTRIRKDSDRLRELDELLPSGGIHRKRIETKP